MADYIPLVDAANAEATLAAINAQMVMITNALEKELEDKTDDERSLIFSAQVMAMAIVLGDTVRANMLSPLTIEIVAKLVKEGRNSIPEIATDMLGV